MLMCYHECNILHRIAELFDVIGISVHGVRLCNCKHHVSHTMSWLQQSQHHVMQVKGEIIISEFASENDPDEYEWTVTAEGTGTAQNKLRSYVEKLHAPVLQKLQQYVTALNSLI